MRGGDIGDVGDAGDDFSLGSADGCAAVDFALDCFALDGCFLAVAFPPRSEGATPLLLVRPAALLVVTKSRDLAAD